MGDKPRDWDLPAYAKQQIRIKAWSLVGHYGFGWADKGDIEQRLALEVWRRIGKHDPKRGPLEPFIYWLVEKW